MSTKVLERALRHASPPARPGGITAARSRLKARSIRPAARTGGHPPTSTRAIVRFADVAIDLAKQRATRAGRSLALTAQELTLLALLVRQAGKTVSKQRLAREIWKRAHDGRSNFIEVGVWRLRAKLEGPFNAKLIHSVRGVGYAIAVRAPAHGRHQ